MSGPCPACTTSAVTGGIVASSLYDYLNINFIPKPLFIAAGAVAAYAISSTLMTYGGFRTYKYFAAQQSCHEESEQPMNLKIALEEIRPFHVSANPSNDAILNKMPVPEQSSKIVGDATQGNLIFAHHEGSKIFAKGGLNYIVGSENVDSFYFSLCSTKIENKLTSVIHNYQDHLDSIHIFCSKHLVSAQDLHLHINHEEHFTVLAIDDGEKNTAITILGEHPELLSDVVLNEGF